MHLNSLYNQYPRYCRCETPSLETFSTYSVVAPSIFLEPFHCYCVQGFKKTARECFPYIVKSRWSFPNPRLWKHQINTSKKVRERWIWYMFLCGALSLIATSYQLHFYFPFGPNDNWPQKAIKQIKMTLLPMVIAVSLQLGKQCSGYPYRGIRTPYC